MSEMTPEEIVRERKDELRAMAACLPKRIAGGTVKKRPPKGVLWSRTLDADEIENYKKEGKNMSTISGVINLMLECGQDWWTVDDLVELGGHKRGSVSSVVSQMVASGQDRLLEKRKDKHGRVWEYRLQTFYRDCSAKDIQDQFNEFVKEYRKKKRKDKTNSKPKGAIAQPPDLPPKGASEGVPRSLKGMAEKLIEGIKATGSETLRIEVKVEVRFGLLRGGEEK